MKIQYLIKSVVLMIALTCIVSCTEKEIVVPQISVEVEKTTYQINETVIFNMIGEAQQIAIFTGDSKHDYELFADGGNTGFVVNKKTFSYSYKQPGTYKVVIVSSNFTENGETIKSDTCSVTLNVIDDDATIKTLTCPKVLYDEIAAIDINETDWLIRLPQKIMFAGKVATISSKQRLSFKLASDSTALLINGVKFNATTTYELNNPLTLSLTAHAGNSRDYTLYMLRLPEFASFKINGVDGVIVRNEFSYDRMTMSVTLPVGVDKTALIPEFTLSEGQEVYVNDILLTSSVSVVDFSSPVVFHIKNIYSGKPELIAETEVTVTVQ